MCLHKDLHVNGMIYIQYWKQPKYPSTGKWINNFVIFPYNCLLFNTEKGTTDIGINIDKSQNNFAEINPNNKNTYCMILFIYNFRKSLPQRDFRSVFLMAFVSLIL